MSSLLLILRVRQRQWLGGHQRRCYCRCCCRGPKGWLGCWSRRLLRRPLLDKWGEGCHLGGGGALREHCGGARWRALGREGSSSCCSCSARLAGRGQPSPASSANRSSSSSSSRASGGLKHQGQAQLVGGGALGRGQWEGAADGLVQGQPRGGHCHSAIHTGCQADHITRGEPVKGHSWQGCGRAGRACAHKGHTGQQAGNAIARGHHRDRGRRRRGRLSALKALHSQDKPGWHGKRIGKKI